LNSKKVIVEVLCRDGKLADYVFDGVLLMVDYIEGKRYECLSFESNGRKNNKMSEVFQLCSSGGTKLTLTFMHPDRANKFIRAEFILDETAAIALKKSNCANPK
jgi:hypothetical protein